MGKHVFGAEQLKTKEHFEILDGLRGVAALVIVVFHFMEWVFPDYHTNVIGHGFLAVDFFFCLSGFVIGYAYDSRIAAMGLKEFFKLRLIRLHPLVIFGAVLGLLGFLTDPFSNAPETYTAGQIAILFLCTALMIPLPIMKDRAFNLFGLNAPTWSLFWEYVANLIYALILCRLNKRYLILLLIPAATALWYTAYRSGNLLGGWTGSNFWDGSIRVAYSFLAGLLVFRYHGIIKNRLGFFGLSFLVLLAFLMPHSRWNWVTETLVVLLYFPLMVSLGAGSLLSSKTKYWCNLSGKISYPLYMTHYAAIWIFGNYFTTCKPEPWKLAVIIPTGTLLLVGFAYLVMVVYDLPLRNYLRTKKLKDQ